MFMPINFVAHVTRKENKAVNFPHYLKKKASKQTPINIRKSELEKLNFLKDIL